LLYLNNCLLAGFLAGKRQSLLLSKLLRRTGIVSKDGPLGPLIRKMNKTAKLFY